MATIGTIENGTTPKGSTIEDQIANYVTGEIIEVIINEEEGCACTVDKAENGKYRLMVIDTDAWLNFTVRFYDDKEKALEKTWEF